VQNLSLQITQNTSLTKMADVSNKTSTNADISASNDSSSVFQTMLSKQVQAQQAPAKQAEAKPEEPVSQGNAEPVVNETKDNETKTQAKVSNHAASTTATKKAGDKSSTTDADATGNVSATLTEEVKLDTKKVKVEADAKTSDAAINKTDANSNDLSASTLLPAMNAIPLLNTQAATQLTPDGNGLTQQQRNLDAVLNNALLQSKSASVGASLGTSVDPADAQATADTNIAPDQSSWLDAMLPGAAKQALGAESLNAKLILNVMKDGAAKEIVNKEAAISMPASYQPAAQINANLSTQQAGSANNINVYPGKTGWDQAISQKVVWMVGAGEQSATLTLNPPDLGPLQVVIHVHNDQANTTFISDNAEVRQALQDGLSNLRDKMSESGIQLGQANVSSGEQSQQQFQQAAQQGLGATQFSSNGTASVAEKASAANTLVRVSNGLVDTFA
jgi:flagellar hook-length control protein FliK